MFNKIDIFLFYSTMLTQSKQRKKQNCADFVAIMRHETVTDTTELAKVDRFIINRYVGYNENDLFIDRLFSVVRHLRITCLVINEKEIFIGEIIKLILHLHHLESFMVLSLSMLAPRCLTPSEAQLFRVLSKTNRVSEIVLGRMRDLSEIQFLINLFPLVQYLRVGCENDLLLENFLRFILLKNTKYIRQLSKICMRSSGFNETTLNKLKHIIDFEQLCQNYTIQHVGNTIFLKLNLQC